MENQIDYEAVLADLLSRRKAIDAAIEGIRQVSGISMANGEITVDLSTPPAPKPQNANCLQSDSFFNMSVSDAVYKYLEVMKRPQTLKVIGEALERGGLVHQSSNFSATIHTAIARRKNDFANPKRGQWGLAKWYAPGKKRTEDSNGS